MEEMRQWAVDDTIHPDDRPAYLQAFGRSFAAGDPFEYEAVRTRRFDGVYRWLNMRGLPLRDRQGHIVRWYFLLTEIDDKKRAEDKIRQSEKEARQLLDLSPLHITELGPDGARLYTNRASLDYYGITLEEWKDAGLQQVLHPQDAAIVTRDLPLKLQSGLPFEYEARLRRKDGQYRWFHYRLSPVLGRGRAHHAVVCRRDRYRRSQAGRAEAPGRKRCVARRNRQSIDVRGDCRNFGSPEKECSPASPRSRQPTPAF